MVRVALIGVLSITAVSAGVPTKTLGAAAGDGPITVCVAADSVLRVSLGGACPTSSELIKLDGAAADGLNCQGCDSGSPSRRQHPLLEELEQRVSQLQKSPLLTVVDKLGRRIFTVAPEIAVLYNGAGAALAAIRANEDGGSFTGRSASTDATATLGVSGSNAGVRLTERVPRLDMGTLGAGNFALKILATSTLVLAGIGESRAGTGTLIVGDDTGKMKVSLTVTDGKGALGVFNNDSVGVLTLTEGATSGGLLAIGSLLGDPIVKMGVKSDEYGVVLAGPRAGFPYVPKSGLPGSYFLGCAGGPACLP